MAIIADVVQPVTGWAPEPLPAAAPWLAVWMHVRPWAAGDAAAHAVVDAFRASVAGPFGGLHQTLPDAIEAWLAAADAWVFVPHHVAG